MIYLVIWLALGLITFWFCDKVIREQGTEIGLSEEEIDNWYEFQTQGLAILTLLGPMTFIVCFVKVILDMLTGER